jgi:hypothetical protein
MCVPLPGEEVHAEKGDSLGGEEQVKEFLHQLTNIEISYHGTSSIINVGETTISIQINPPQNRKKGTCGPTRTRSSSRYLWHCWALLAAPTQQRKIWFRWSSWSRATAPAAAPGQWRVELKMGFLALVLGG